MARTLLTPLLAVLLSALSGAGAWGDTWRVAYSEFPPYTFTGADGQPAGFSIDLLREIAALRGVKLAFQHTPNPGAAIALMQAGVVDIHPNLSRTPAREAVLAFADPHSEIRLQVFARAANASTVGRRLAAARAGGPPLRIAVTKGSIANAVARATPWLEPRPIATTEKLYFALAGGAEGAALFSTTSLKRLDDMLAGPGSFAPVDAPLRRAALHFAVAAARTDLVAALDGGLRDVRAGTAMEAIRTRWFGTPEAGFTAAFVMLLLGGVVGFCLVIVAGVAVVVRWRNARILAAAEARRQVEREALLAELERRNETLRAKAKELEDLLYVVSHDLSSPLVSISGFAIQAQRALVAGKGERAQMAFGRISANAREMANLIRVILELGRLGRASVEPGRVDLAALVGELRRLLSALIQERRVELVARALPVVHADRQLLKTALQNLIVNAIRHGCPQSGMRVEILVETGDGTVRIGVRDSGPGIAMTDQARLFEPYRRLSEEARGQGIGLGVVSKVAALHDGRVEVVSVPGEGATFWIVLPAGAVRTTPSSLEAAA